MLLFNGFLVAAITTTAMAQLQLNDGGVFSFPRRDRKNKDKDKAKTELAEIASAFGDPHFHIIREGSADQPDLCFDIGKRCSVCCVYIELFQTATSVKNSIYCKAIASH